MNFRILIIFRFQGTLRLNMLMESICMRYYAKKNIKKQYKSQKNIEIQENLSPCNSQRIAFIESELNRMQHFILGHYLIYCEVYPLKSFLGVQLTESYL